MRRPIVFVVLAGLAAMLASVVVYSALKKREAEVQQAMAKNVQIVVAAYDLPLGTKIEPGELKLAKWSNDAIPEGAYTDPKQVVGNYVKGQFVANEPIVANKLFVGQKTAGVLPLLIPFGMRAVSVPVDEVSDIAGFVLPHTRVDVLVALSGGDGSNKPFSKVVLQNVEVLAVAQEVEMKKDEPQVVKVVTLLVSPQEAERLSLASREGTLRLAMRNYNDNKIVLTSGSDIQQMLHSYSLQPDVPVMSPQAATPHKVAAPAPVRRKPFEVEIFRNGKSSESMSFINEAALNSDGSHKKGKIYDRVQSKADTDSAASDQTASADSAGDTARASHVAKVSKSVSRDDRTARVASADSGVRPGSASEASLSGTTPAYAPTPKTIDIP